MVGKYILLYKHCLERERLVWGAQCAAFFWGVQFACPATAGDFLSEGMVFKAFETILALSAAGAVDVTIRMLVTSLAISNFGTEQQLSIRVQESKHFDGLKMAAGRVAS